jgi:LPXTG-motif cell wall-anchored protein
MMKKMLTAPVVAGVLLFAPVAVAQASNVETTPPADEAAADEDDGDDDSSKVGLWGLLGLAGLAGLAGLKRRETAVRYDSRPTV